MRITVKPYTGEECPTVGLDDFCHLSHWVSGLCAGTVGCSHEGEVRLAIVMKAPEAL